MPAARSHHPGVARLSRVARGRQGCGLLLSRRRVPPPRRRGGGIRASRHRILRPHRQGGGRCRDAGARAGSDDALWLERAGNPHGRRRIVFRLRRRARSGAGVEAPPGQGFQSQDLAGARSRSDHAQFGQRRAGISRRARRAVQFRSEGRASPGDGSFVDRRHRRGRRPFRRRDRRPFSRTGGAERADATAARNPRLDRALPRGARRSRRSGGRTAHALKRRQNRARPRARSVRDPRRISRRARRRRARHQILDRLRPRFRLLHRLRVRAARPTRQKRARRRRPL